MSRICSNPKDCCRELSRVWDALGVTHYVIGQGSCSEQVARLKARAEAAEAALATVTEQRDEANAKAVRVLRGEFTQICSYCGWESPGPASWEQLQAHIHACELHPIQQLTIRAEAAEAERDALAAQVRVFHPTIPPLPEQ